MAGSRGCSILEARALSVVCERWKAGGTTMLFVEKATYTFSGISSIYSPPLRSIDEGAPPPWHHRRYYPGPIATSLFHGTRNYL